MSISIKILAVFEHRFWSMKNQDCNGDFDQTRDQKTTLKKSEITDTAREKAALKRIPTAICPQI